MTHAVNLTGLGKRYILRDHAGNPVRRMARYFLKGPRPEREHWALRNVNVQIAPGESVALIGVNGSGKSTLLRAIAGITTPTQGTVTISGRVGGVVDLGAGFHGDLTGFENIFLHGTLLGLSRAQIRARLKQIEEFCELGPFLHSQVRQYSLGMFLRLGFSVAVHSDPDIFIVDEALAVGDGYFQWKCLRKISELKQEGKTILFVSHIPDVAETICERALWIHEGHIRADGKCSDIVHQYNQYLFQHLLEGEPEHHITKLSALLPYSRCGTGEAVISDVKLLDSSDQIQQCFVTGSLMRVQFKVIAKRPLSNTAVYLWHSTPAFALSFVDSNQESRTYDLDEGINLISVSYPQLPVRQGNYHLSIGVGPAGPLTDKTVLYDCHQKIYTFTVLEPQARLELLRDRVFQVPARVELTTAPTG